MAAITQVAIPQVDERAARRTLRDQIGRLERELDDRLPRRLPADRPRPADARRGRAARPAGARELERVRDELAGRLSRVRGEIDAQLLRAGRARALLERMLRDPPAHKWVRVSNAAPRRARLQHFHVRPRLGLIGMLPGWWHVKISWVAR